MDQIWFRLCAMTISSSLTALRALPPSSLAPSSTTVLSAVLAPSPPLRTLSAHRLRTACAAYGSRLRLPPHTRLPLSNYGRFKGCTPRPAHPLNCHPSDPPRRDTGIPRVHPRWTPEKRGRPSDAVWAGSTGTLFHSCSSRSNSAHNSPILSTC
ncbi:hypothetical protein BKA93DRAFT_803203 [Sparassis latifolia]